MKNIIKFVFGLIFSLGFFISANAQTDSASGEMDVPSPDDIVCVQVAENVFECAITDPKFREEEYDSEEGTEQDQIEPSDESEMLNEGTEGQEELNDPSSEEFLYEEGESSEQDQEIFQEGTTEEEIKSECERILDENMDQSKGNEDLEQEDLEQDKQDLNDPALDDEYEPFPKP